MRVLRLIAGVVDRRDDWPSTTLILMPRQLSSGGVSRSSLMLPGALNPASWSSHSSGLIGSHSLIPFALVAARR